MLILGIDTSCDDTCAAVLSCDLIFSNIISSQVNIHAQWGGVVPTLAKRAHQAQILPCIHLALKRAHTTIQRIDLIAITIGPGLSPALSVGVNAARDLADTHHKKITAVNHIEAHLLSPWLKNRHALPSRSIKFPALALTVSGGHTKVVLIEKIGSYQIIGQTLDDAAGEALDKSAKLLGLGYPGGPVLERLARNGDPRFLKLPQPLSNKKILDFSFSGLKTAFYYQIKDWPKVKISRHLFHLAASFQSAVFDALISKFSLAITKTQPQSLLAAGGVLANRHLRCRLRRLSRQFTLPLYLPFKKELNTDNAAMVALAAYLHPLKCPLNPSPLFPLC